MPSVLQAAEAMEPATAALVMATKMAMAARTWIQMPIHLMTSTCMAPRVLKTAAGCTLHRG